MSISEGDAEAPFKPGQEPEYNEILERLLNILQANGRLSKMVSEWRVGDLPEKTMATAFPAVYVAMSRRPQAGRTIIGAAPTPDNAPAQHVVTEVYVVCLATGADAAEAQLSLYSVTSTVRSILLTNNRLAWEGADPLCGTIDISEVPRMERQIGKPLEGMTFLIRLHNYRYDAPSTA